MKILLIAITIFAASAQARTNSMFRRSGDQATVFVSGMAGDLDALNLYNTLTAPEQILDGKRTKHMNFNRSFSIVCVLSALIKENGTCTVIFKPGTNIDRARSYAQYTTENPTDLAQLRQDFLLPTGAYNATDGHFSLTMRTSQDRATYFEMLYR